jgi:hypothetical protein
MKKSMWSDFFKDDTGNYSSTRLIVVGIVLYAMCISAYTVTVEGSAAAIAVFSSMTGIAAGWKLMQKGQEVKQSNSTKPL